MPEPEVPESDIPAINSTQAALLARGFDSHLARRLVRDGHTVSLLKQRALPDLETLGIPQHMARSLLSESRPPIPNDVLHRALYDSARTCCACFDGTKSVILHHIIPWEESRSHEIANLVVLCLEHHGEAHSNHELSQNLDPDALRRAKRTWENEVRKRRADAIFRPHPLALTGAFWDYFNIQRLVDVFSRAGLSARSIPEHRDLLAEGAISSDGLPLWAGNQPASSVSYRYASCHPGTTRSCLRLYDLMLHEILRFLPFVDVTDIWNRTRLSTSLASGSIYVCTAGHIFKRLHRFDAIGPGQNRTGYRQANNVRLEFSMDGFEATSSSSHGSHLSGRWYCTSIGIVRSLERVSDQLKINCTVLAIGTGFTNRSPRTPAIAWSSADESDGEN